MMPPELSDVPPMQLEPGTLQQPLQHGDRGRLPHPWVSLFWGAQPSVDAGDAANENGLTITSLAELDALAERDVVASDPNDAIEPDDSEDEANDAADFSPAQVRCDLSRSPVLTPWGLRARIVHDCADRLAALGEHRAHWPMARKADTERRCLAQLDAILCIGSGALSELEYWRQANPTPWASWAYVFALASLDGREALAGIAAHVAELGPEQREHRRLAAEAFAASSNPHAEPLARACLATPVGMGFAIELLSLRGLIDASALDGWLERPEPEVRACALHAWARLSTRPENVQRFESLVDTTDPDLAWEAARALSLWGSGAPLSAMRHGGALLDVLGPRAVELFVLCGHPDDAALVQRLVRRHEMTESLLDAVARLGHPGVWAFICHYLGDPALEGAAAQALATLFGDIVNAREKRDPFAWEKAIAALHLKEGERYRRGRPWSARVVAEECASGLLSRRAVELRLDELRARAGICTTPRLFGWSEQHQGFDAELLSAAEQTGARR